MQSIVLVLLLIFIIWPDHDMVLPSIETGWWSQYAENPTLWQIDYHSYQDEKVDGFIAALDCNRVGSYAWITINDSPWQHVKVFDCLGSWDGGDPTWWEENNVIGEIDYYLADKFDVVGQGGVKARLVWVE